MRLEAEDAQIIAHELRKLLLPDIMRLIQKPVEPERWTKRQIAQYIGCSRTQVNRYIACPDFPKSIGEGRFQTWAVEEVKTWWAARR